jgi:pyridoxal phosphate enzyme (YggS family)
MHHEGTKERSEAQEGPPLDRPLLSPDGSPLVERIEGVHARIRAAAHRAGRNPTEVTLIAVSKTQDAERVEEAYRAGVRLFGENRVEEAGPKAKAVADLLAPEPPPSWHMVGHLQSRKAADALPWAAMIHSVESEKLARRLSRFCAEQVREMPVLIEVNVAGEDSKYGVLPAALAELANLVAGLPGLRLEGLMTVAPIAADPEDVRPVFASLRALRDDLAERFPGLGLRHLSMGMTDDFEVAIEEGATLIRIGRAIFGERNG